MYSPTPIPLEPNNTSLSDNALSDNALSNNTRNNNALSAYQKATLQTMGIVLYELRDAISAAESVDVIESTHPSVQELIFIDEADAFIKQLFSIFDVSSSAELGLTWQVQDNETVMLKDNTLITPDAKTLRKSDLKKQLWGTLQVFFKTKEWS